MNKKKKELKRKKRGLLTQAEWDELYQKNMKNRGKKRFGTK